MAWTIPRTWVDKEVVTKAIMDTHVRDNLNALSTHAHTGAAGDGNDELSGIDLIQFDDVAISPDAAGELQRKGSNLEWYGAAVVAITQADAAAATASPRTLGTGAQQAAAGDHTHVPSEVVTSGSTNLAPLSTGYSVILAEKVSNLGAAGVDLDLRSETRTPGAATRILVGYAGVSILGADSTTVTIKIWFDSVEKDSVAFVMGAGLTGRDIIIDWIASAPSVAVHTFKVTIRVSALPANEYVTCSPIRILEVKV